MNSRFLRFAAVGGAGFLVDAGTLYVAIAAGAGPYLGRVLSYLAAATATWAMNRRFTFGTHRTPHPWKEWVRFLAANAVGGALNWSVYAALVASSTLVHANPVIGVAVGSIAGLIVNYALSHRLVFRKHRDTTS